MLAKALHGRDFVFSSYVELKKANPKFPILIRECETASAKLVARYGGYFSQERIAKNEPVFKSSCVNGAS